MQDKTILYKAKVDKFSKRIVMVFYPFIVIPSVFLIIPFFNKNLNNPITIIWVAMMLSIITMMLISSYKWTTNQIASLTINNDLFEIELITKNTKQVHKFDKHNIKTILKWQGGLPRILKLTLLDNDNKIAEFYSGGKQKMEYALEEIAYKINKNKTPT